jgi:pyruvate dehydrogenase E2 component (dihydrolipoamide acetyltransferase)
MPSLGADMDVGTVLEWLVQPGDEVHRGDVVAVVDTAKAAVEVEVFADGVVDEIVVPVGQEVPVGTLLATLAPVGAAVAEKSPAAAVGTPSVAAPAPAPEPVPVPAEPPVPEPAVPEAVPPEPVLVPAPAAVHVPAPPSAPVPVASPLVRHLAHQRGVDLVTAPRSGENGAVTRDDVERAAGRQRRRSSPHARRRAAELGLDLAAVEGTGAEGAVLVSDVERAAAERIATPVAPEPSAPPTAGPPAAREPATGAAGPADRQQAMRRAIAALMARSKREVPHYYLSTTIDLTRATEWLREANRTRPVADRLVPTALLLKATALACRKVPEVNGFWRDDAFVAADDVHLGVAIALRGGGLVTPALHAADGQSLDDLMTGLRDLVARSRAGRLRQRELTEGTITVTNLGDQGVESVLGVIFPPQVALVGFGRVVERPWAVDGLLGVRPVVTATLAADHRATDGHIGGRYLTALDRLLQTPEQL